MIYLISVFLLLTTFTILNIKEPIRTPKEIMAIIGFFSIYWFSKKGSLTKWLWAFVGWGVFDTFWLRYRHFAISDPKIEIIAFNVAFKNIAYILLACIAIQVLSEAKRFSSDLKFKNLTIKSHFTNKNDEVSFLIDFISKIAIFIGCYCLFIQAPGFDQYMRVLGESELGSGVFIHRMVGTLGNPSIMSMWFAMSLPCLLHSKRYVGFGIVALSMFLMKGNLGFIAGITAIMFYLLFKHRKLFFVFLTIFLISLSALFFAKIEVKDVSRYKQFNIVFKNKTIIFGDEGRLTVWKKSWEELKPMYLTGTGLGSYQFVFAPKMIPLFNYGSNSIWRNPHNEYIRILCETGFIGLGFFLMFCLNVMWRFIKSKKTPVTITLMSVLVAFLINSIFMFPAELGPIIFMGIIFTGFLCNLLQKEDVYV